MFTFKTNFGDIVLQLTPEETPITVKNFLNYARTAFYDGTIFHRVIDDFMIQGGGFEPNMTQKLTNARIQNEAEFGGSNLRGTIAMARMADPHSAASQFFINISDNPFLDFKQATDTEWGYCVFGRVLEGMTVVDEIKKIPTGHQNGHEDVPITPVIIEQVLLDDSLSSFTTG